MNSMMKEHEAMALEVWHKGAPIFFNVLIVSVFYN